jgi:hypothetical protein
MLYRNISWIIGLFMGLTSFIAPPKFAPVIETKRWVISENSNLSVNGTTNINKFACDIPAYGQTDTITLAKGKNDIVLSGNIGLKIQSFDCHNSMMTHDLRKTLKESVYPLLHINFLSLSNLPRVCRYRNSRRA